MILDQKYLCFCHLSQEQRAIQTKFLDRKTVEIDRFHC